MTSTIQELSDWKDPVSLLLETPAGLSEEVVRFISQQKNEPLWMLEKRLLGLKLYNDMPLPSWGPSLSNLELEKIHYFRLPNAKHNASSWEDLPDDVKKTFEKLGIPEAEKKSLSGAGAQYESLIVYHKLKKEWEEVGVLFEDMDVAVQKYPELVQQYFMICVPPTLHKFAALHAAVWSGGTFIYIPKGVKLTTPLQAYFRMNAQRGGQFEHTLIIVEEDAEVQYIEGCSAPQYASSSIHAGCVEVFVKKNARARYSSVESWSKNTYNLNTKRSIVEERGVMEWIGGNLGCLTGDTLIFTNKKGPIPIKELKGGDKIFAIDEKERSIKKATITSMVYSGEKEVFRVEVAGRHIEASSNHPFLSLERISVQKNKRKGRFIVKWKPLEQLKRNDIIAIAKRIPDTGMPHPLPNMRGYKNKMYKSKNQYGAEFTMKREYLYNNYTFPKKTTEEFMWFLGVMIGDGHVWIPEKHGAKINIAIPESCDLRDPLIKVIRSIFKYSVTYRKDRFIIINSRPIAEFIKKIGFAGNADTKKLPQWVHTLPNQQKLAFLGGYFDSDGHVNKGGVYITSINKKLLEGVRELAVSCGIGVSRIFSHGKARKQIILGVKCNAKESFRILLNGKHVDTIHSRSAYCKKEFKKLVTRRDYGSAKGLNFRSMITSDVGFSRIQSITSQGIKPTYDIEVEGYHNFIANGIIVHNSGVTMLYPCTILKGDHSRTDHIAIAFAGKGQNQDTGAKVYHVGNNTASLVTSKSISKDGGITSYRGIVKIGKNAKNSKSTVECDALMIDNESQINTSPVVIVENNESHALHEATVGKISPEKIFYLTSRGIPENEAKQMIVAGFIEPITKLLPMEYAVELNKLIELEMEGTLG